MAALVSDCANDPRAGRGDRIVDRRKLMLLLAGAMTAASTLRAQQKAMPVIGYLGATSAGPAAPFMAAFHQGLKGDRLHRGTKPGDRIPVGGGPL
jgi:hypothetical protein